MTPTSRQKARGGPAREDRPRRGRRVLRGALLGGLALAVLGGAAGGALVLGYQSAERGIFPAELLARVDRKIERDLLDGRPPEKLGAARISSHLIDLEQSVALLDVDRDDLPFDTLAGNGGGLAGFGEDVLLLPYGGRVFALGADGAVRPTTVQAPDNGRAAYEAAVEDEAFAAVDVRPGLLRYNDLLHFEGGGAQGLVASYTEYHADRACYTNTVAKLEFDPAVGSIDAVEAGPDDWTILHRTEPCLPFKAQHAAMEGHMAGGRMAFEAPSTVYVTSGDYHIDGMRSKRGYVIAQDEAAEYGKLLAVDLRDGATRIVSSGHRNPQGLAFGPEGRLFVVEHGPRGGDELNLVREGANYGWPLESYGTTYYGRGAIPGALSYGRHETFERPVFSWVPSVATSALAYVEGFDPSWDGDLLVASLLDASLYRLRLEGDRVIYDERIEIGSRLRAMTVHAGRIVIWTDNQELVTLLPGERTDRSQHLANFVEATDMGDEMAVRLNEAVASCAECHSFAAGDHEKAPGLSRIHGNAVASTEYDGYSDALARLGGTWTSERLAAYVADPEAVAPGTSMPDPGIDDEAVIEVLVAYLENIDTAF